ncbi:MAG: glycosyl hydrolase [Limisphaerales bacterium]
MNAKHPSCLLRSITAVLLMAPILTAQGLDALDAGFDSPPPQARLRAYWWWLNGNVTREAITRDLEAMAAQGFGGALICDAGGAEQRGNDQVPHGPDFGSAEWRILYRHALSEAHRLGLELSLNIQSGWNLGGPGVSASDAPKRLVWTTSSLSNSTGPSVVLPLPEHASAYYQDLYVLAYPLNPQPSQTETPLLIGSSSDAQYPAALSVDSDPDTYWVSGPFGKGQTLGVRFSAEATISRLQLQGRPGYGPKALVLEARDQRGQWIELKKLRVPDGELASIAFEPTTTRELRLAFTEAYDPRQPQQPRNVQVSEFQLFSPRGEALIKSGQKRELLNFETKALHRALHSSAPDTAPLLKEAEIDPGEHHALSSEVIDVTSMMKPDGTLNWHPPDDSTWEVLRIGCTLNKHCRVSTCSEGWDGYALDPFDLGAFRRYWESVVEPLLQDAGPLAGTTLRYLHTDSWEVEVANWTPTLPASFARLRGYELLPYLPVLAGKIIDNRHLSNRFLHDFRKTMGDLAVENHYRPFSEWARRHGLLLHPESGGPHAVPVDSLRCLGMDDAPMSEFWAWSWTHRVGDANRFFVKQPASAAHTYGRNLVLAEGFTTIGPHWQETLWDNLQPAFNRALTEGLNRLVWHTFTCSPEEMGMPGQQYFAGTHLNPNVTWWSRSRPFFDTLNRCQFMLQQGTFVADIVYYYGDHVPNFAQLKGSDPAGILPGYDYDVITEDALLQRLTFQDGRLRVPDVLDQDGTHHSGVSYAALVLPNHSGMSLPVLRKVEQLVSQGATIIGPKPLYANGLMGYPDSDEEMQAITDRLWSSKPSSPARAVTTQSTREVLLNHGILPDFEWVPNDHETSIDYIHRRTEEADIYFVANASNRTERVDCTFRVKGRQPELWDPRTGERRDLRHFSATSDGRTRVRLEFAPYGSWFIVFRGEAPSPERQHGEPSDFLQTTALMEIPGPWRAAFDPAWGGPGEVIFNDLIDWTLHPNAGIRHYSGTATYTTTFPWVDAVGNGADQRKWLDLGLLRELAEVRLNGKPLGILWSPPFRTEITGCLRPGENTLEIDIVNFWPNRIIGDAALPREERLTQTNVRQLKADTPLVSSGLFGPVQILGVEKQHDRDDRTDGLDVEMSLDVDHPVGQLGPIWRFFGADEPNYATWPNGRKLLDHLGEMSPGQVYFRAHNLLCSGNGTPALKWGSTGVYREDAEGQPIYDWTILDSIFDTYLEHGVRPYAQIGFMPRDLSSRPEPYQHKWTPGLPYNDVFTGWSYPPKDYQRWAELVAAWVRHSVDRYGAEEVSQWYWETWNEANIPYWQGSPEEFRKLHDFAINAVRDVLPTARVGGPDTAGHGGQWMRDFLDHCLRGTNYATGEIGTPLDFVSFHAKGSPVFTNGHVRMGIANQLRTINDGFELIASYPELKNTPIVIGESDPEGCAACQGPQLGYRNGTMYSSYTAASFARKHDLAAMHGVRLEGALTWAFEFENQPYFAGFRSLASNGIDKPVLHVFRMMSMMGPHRLQVSSSHAIPLTDMLEQGVRQQPDVSGLAARSQDGLQLLVWNYHDDDVPGPTAHIRLSLRGLPTSSDLHGSLYRVDQQHGNAYTVWLAMGSPQSPTSAQYAELEQASLLPAQPALVHTDEQGETSLMLDLPRQGVALLTLQL